MDARPENTEPPIAGYKDLVVGVEEKNTGTFTVGAAFSSVDQIVGFAEVAQGNFDLFHPPTFTGGGQKFRLRVQIGTVRQTTCCCIVQTRVGTCLMQVSCTIRHVVTGTHFSTTVGTIRVTLYGTRLTIVSGTFRVTVCGTRAIALSRMETQFAYGSAIAAL